MGRLWFLEVVMVEVFRITRPLLGSDQLAVKPVDAIERGCVESIVDVAIQYLKLISPNPDDGAILLFGILDDFSRATQPPRRLSIPYDDKYVAMVHHILPACL